MRREQVYTSPRLAGAVKRYHTWPMLGQQTVAEHAWRVAGIYVEIFGLPRAEVLYYCLHHDSGELWAGDLPFGTKIGRPILKQLMDDAEAKGREQLNLSLPELSEQELVQVKICDLLEMHELGAHECLMGNQYAEPIKQDTVLAAQCLAAKACVSDLVARWLNGGLNGE